MQVTSMPSIPSRTWPVGSRPGATEPAVSRKLIVIGAEVPGTPSMRAVALVFDLAVRRLHRDVALHVGVERQHAQRGGVALRLDQAGLERERHHGGEHVAAVGRGVDGVLVGLQLREQEIEIDAGPGALGDDADLAGQRMRAAEAVDLALVGRAHHRKQHPVARRDVGGQVGGVEERAARGAAAHEQAGNGGLHGEPGGGIFHFGDATSPPPPSATSNSYHIPAWAIALSHAGNAYAGNPRTSSVSSRIACWASGVGRLCAEMARQSTLTGAGSTSLRTTNSPERAEAATPLAVSTA